MKFDPKKVNALAVCLHGRQIGVINRLAGERHIFAFEQDYIADPQRPTLSLSFKSSTGGLVTAFCPVSFRVPPFFSNLLPEGRMAGPMTPPPAAIMMTVPRCAFLWPAYS